MNEITLPSGATAYYQYDPRADGLEIRLRPGVEATESAPLAGMPHVKVLRARATGEVVALAVSGVQSLLLDRLVADLVVQALAPSEPRNEAPTGSPSTPAAPQTAPPQAKEPPAAPPPAAAALPMVYDDTDELDADGQPKRRRRRRRRRGGRDAPDTTGATASEGVAEGAAGAETDTTPAVAAAVPSEPATPPAEATPSVTEPVADPGAFRTAAADAPAVAVDEGATDGAVDATARPPESTPRPLAAVPWPPMVVQGEDAVAADDAPVPEQAHEAAAAEATVETEATAATAMEAAPAEATFASAAADERVSPRPRRKRRRRSRKGDREPVTHAQADQSAELEAATAAHVAAEPVPEGLATPEGFRFLGLDERLGQAVAALGFDAPTPIQRRAVPPAMTGRDLVGLAQTGTGKTAAFLLPALHRLLGHENAGHSTRLLVVTPTRELAVQVGEQAIALARFTPLRVAVVYGGAGMGAQISALRRGADVVVATPGRLLDHVSQRNLRLDAVEVLVLDESDRMLDMGFIPDIRRIIGLVPDGRQTFLFGATLPPDIEQLTQRFQRDPELVEVARQLPPETLEQELYPVGRHLKLPLLVHLLQREQELTKVMVFAETKNETDIVARQLQAAGLRVASMHGDRVQRDRERALEDLRSGRVQVLVATNVAARGLDIEDVTHVVNYDMPQTVDEYIHRIGRTARGAGTEGTAYSFVTVGDESMVRRIESALERELPRVKAEGFDYDVPTPSWAQPSAEDLTKAMVKPSLSQLSRSFRGGFRRKRR